MHTVEPAREYEPGGQMRQEDGKMAPVMDENVPAGHKVQFAAPGCAPEKEPGAHGWQYMMSGAHGKELAVPSGHG
jgi:hypothetical protein